MTKARNRTIKLINDLKSSSLLLESEKEGNYVKMHDVVRDFARSIVSKHIQNIRIRKNNVSIVSCDDFDDVSRKLKFSELELLVLASDERGRDTQVPEAFFNEMDNIKVLEFEGEGISMLPASIRSLTNLRTLSLLRCTYLKNIDVINDLKGLEILSVRRSYIKELPLAISQFTQLKVLNLSDCWNLVIAPNILSRLTNLEELNLKNSFTGWEGEFVNNKKERASLSELKCLPRLEALQIWIPNEKILSRQMFLARSKLERFEIIIGKRMNSTTTQNAYGKVLKLSLNSTIMFSIDLTKLVNSAEEMVLGGLIRENDVFSKFGEFHENDGFSNRDEFHLHPQLKHLSIYNNSDMDHIFSETDVHLFHAWATLECLYLKGMRNLKSMICSDIIPKADYFEKLRIIQVKSCYKMRNLFVFPFMKCLPNIQSIEVEDCRMMEGIVAKENKNNKLQFHQLKCLILRQLPQFTSFCLQASRRRSPLLDLDSQQFDIIEQGNISNFNTLFNEQDEFTKLEELKITKVDQLKMIWHDKHKVDSFSQLKQICVENCENLSNVFSSSVIKGFKTLKSEDK